MPIKLKEIFLSSPLYIALVYLLGFALPNSDTASISLAFLAIISIFAIVLWSRNPNFSPAISERIEFKFIALILLALLLTIVLPLFLSLTIFGTQSGKGITDPSATILEFTKLLGIVSAFSIGVKVAQSNRNGEKSFDAILTVISIWAICSIIMFIHDPNGTYGMVKFSGGRLNGAFSSSNSAGTLFASAVAASSTRLIHRWSANPKMRLSSRISILSLAHFFACLSALFLSQSRGAWIACMVSLAIVSILMLVKYKFGALIPIASTLILIIIIPLLFGWSDKLLERFGAFSIDYQSRNAIFEYHLNAFKAHPFFGNGLGSFATINNQIINEKNYLLLNVLNAAHNVYIQWLEECGIVGFVLLITLNLIVFIKVITSLFYARKSNSRVFAGVAMYLVLIVHSFSDYATQEPVLAALFATIVGIILTLSGNSKQSKTPKLGSKQFIIG